MGSGVSQGRSENSENIPPHRNSYGMLGIPYGSTRMSFNLDKLESLPRSPFTVPSELSDFRITMSPRPGFERRRGSPRSDSSFEMLELISHHGHFGMGPVWKTLCKDDDKIYETTVLHHEGYRFDDWRLRFYNEIDDFVMIDYPFLNSFRWIFESEHSIYVICDCYEMDLFQLQSNAPNKMFTEQETEFCVMEILMGLLFLHMRGICHCNVTPENVLVNNKGHISLKGFYSLKDRCLSPQETEDESDIAPRAISGGQKLERGRETTTNSFWYACNSPCHTPEYMAPEMISSQVQQGDLQKNYSFEVDYWALGCLTYECLHAVSPFFHQDVRQIFIATFQGKHKPISGRVSREAAKFIKSLLHVDASKRLVNTPETPIQSNAFFRSFSWDEISRRESHGLLIPEYQQRRRESIRPSSQFANSWNSEDDCGESALGEPPRCSSGSFTDYDNDLIYRRNSKEKNHQRNISDEGVS